MIKTSAQEALRSFNKEATLGSYSTHALPDIGILLKRLFKGSPAKQRGDKAWNALVERIRPEIGQGFNPLKGGWTGASGRAAEDVVNEVLANNPRVHKLLMARGHKGKAFVDPNAGKPHLPSIQGEASLAAILRNR